MKKIIVLVLISLMFPIGVFAQEAVGVDSAVADTAVSVPTPVIGIPAGPATPINPVTPPTEPAPQSGGGFVSSGSGGQNLEWYRDQLMQQLIVLLQQKLALLIELRSKN